MDQLLIEWQNVEALLKYAISAFIALSSAYGYLKAKGIKFASVEKVLEYREIKDSFVFIQKYISIAEITAIIKYISKESENAGKLTPEIKEKAFEMFVDALKSKESGHP